MTSAEKVSDVKYPDACRAPEWLRPVGTIRQLRPAGGQILARFGGFDQPEDKSWHGSAGTPVLDSEQANCVENA